MLFAATRNLLRSRSIRQQQTENIIFITFWSQFSVYALNTILILFLTRPLLKHGLGYSQAKAYAFFGVTQATSYLMPILGGYMADQVLGIRRAILAGSILLALAYLMVMLSGYTLHGYGDSLFIMAYALVPACNSLLMGTASGLISQIYQDDTIQAKSAMTFYYMAINVGALLATIIAPALLDSRYGPLSVLALTFVGKSIAALNFAQKYSLYNNVVQNVDKLRMTSKMKYQLFAYVTAIYCFTLFAYSQIILATYLISIGCTLGIGWFFVNTLRLKGFSQSKQLVAVLLIVEAVIFFVIYNQMSSTLVLFAQSNSDLNFFGLTISPAHYQLLNPLLIILLGSQLPRFYRLFPQFSTPYQFAGGTILAGIALIFMAYACAHAANGLVNGNFIALTYVLITLAELWVSAIGLSMIGLYCDGNALAFAMGVWYLASSLSNTISGSLARYAVIPEKASILESLSIYQKYYFGFGVVSLLFGVVMLGIAYYLHRYFKRFNEELP